MATNENLPPNVIKQLAKELKNLDETPPEGIKVVVNDDDFSTIFADVEGPAGTPYENGVFRMKLLLSHDFPHSPPKGYFLTKIFHPNIATNGEICVNTLKKDWNPSLGLRHVLIVSTVWHFCVFEVKTFLFVHTGRAVFTIRIPPILFEIFGCKLGNFYFIDFFYGNRWSGVC